MKTKLIIILFALLPCVSDAQTTQQVMQLRTEISQSGNMPPLDTVLLASGDSVKVYLLNKQHRVYIEPRKDGRINFSFICKGFQQDYAADTESECWEKGIQAFYDCYYLSSINYDNYDSIKAHAGDQWWKDDYLRPYDTKLAAEMATDLKNAEAGNAIAQHKVGLEYLFDIRTCGYDTSNQEYGLQYITKAAEQGNIEALIDRGFCHVLGIGVPKDIEKGLGFLKQAADTKDANAIGEYADAVLNFSTEPDAARKAFDIYQKGAETTGDWILKCAIADFYLRGDVVEKDTAKALKIYQDGVANGNGYAYYKMGKRYLYGKYVEKDLEKAKSYFEKAEVVGSPQWVRDWASYSIGDYYEEKNDYEQALRQYKKCYNNSRYIYVRRSAAFQMGWLCYNKLDDIEQAKKWHEKALPLNYPSSNYWLGCIYEDKLWYSDAISSFEKVTMEAGNSKSQCDNAIFHLGFCHYKRWDYKNAALYFKKYADKGYAGGNYWLAWSYIRQEEKDSAIVYFNKVSEEAGNSKVQSDDAHHQLGRLYYSKNDFANAARHLKVAAENNSANSDDLYKLGVMCIEQQNDYESALKYLAGTDDEKSAYYRGIAYYHTGDYKNASSNLTDAIENEILSADEKAIALKYKKKADKKLILLQR